MPINLAGGYAAGGVHDALLEIIKQRMLEQELAQRQEENQFQRLRADRLDKRQADQDAIAAEERKREAEKRRYDILNSGLPQADLNTNLGEDMSTAHVIPTTSNPNIPGGGPSYTLPAVPIQSKMMSVEGVQVRPRSKEVKLEDARQGAYDEAMNKAYQLSPDEQAVYPGKGVIASGKPGVAKPVSRSELSGFIGKNGEPIQIDQEGNLYVGTQKVPVDYVHKIPPSQAPVVILGPNGPMIVDRGAGTGKAVQEVGPGGQPTGVTIGNKLPPIVVAKIGDVDSVITGINDMIGLKKDEWLGPLQGWMTKARIETPGMDVPKELADFAALTSTIRNATIKAITGAQMSEQEAKRITEQIPEFTDKPSVWLANAQATIKNLTELRAKVLALSGAQSDTVGVSGGRGGGARAGGTTGGTITVTDPQGGKHQFSTQAEADAFKKLAGIK